MRATMNNFLDKKWAKILFMIVFFIPVFLGLSPYSVFAADNDPIALIVSWKSGSGVPMWYQGKSLPTYQSPIAFSVVAVGKGSSAGQIISLKNTQIKWSVNSKYIGGGQGVQTVIYNNKTIFPGGDLNVSVSVESQDSQTGSKFFVTKYFTVPIVEPKVIIQGAPFNYLFSSGADIVLNAIPFFFNVSSTDDLTFNWSINGQKKTEADNTSSISIHVGDTTPASARIDLSVTNPSGSFFEKASRSLMLKNNNSD